MQNLKKFRAKADYTQQQLANLSGLSRATINYLETKDDYNVSEEKARQIADILNCSVFSICNIKGILKYQPRNKEEAELLIQRITEEYL